MARKLHRDPSSLSRWERGLQVPRDIEQVIAAYRELEPLASQRATATQLERTDSVHVNRGFIAIIASRWLGLGIVVMVEKILGGDGSVPADTVRLFIAGSVLVALGCRGVHLRQLGRFRVVSPGEYLVASSWGAGLLFLAHSCARRIGDPRLHVGPAGLAVLITEIALVGLAWHVK